MEEYDVVVIGSGIAGATLALCLARTGVKVLVVEHKTHPRFVIGESTIVITTFNFNYLGKKYGIDELDGLSTYWRLRRSGEVTCFPKCHFWYGCHQEGEELKRAHQLMAETFAPPQGPDVHFVRSDLDAHLVSLFPKYGVHYLDRTSIVNFDNSTQGVTLNLSTRTGEEAKPTQHIHNEAAAEEGMPSLPESTSAPILRVVKAKYAVDASGHSAYLSRKFKLLQKEPQLATRTRTIYGHFNYPDGWNLDNYCTEAGADFRYSRHAGTQHHFFPGGWIWVIPFDNNTVSVGLVLDIDKYPIPKDVNKDKEFWMVINKYPTIKKHLSPLQQCVPFVRTGRIQLKSDTILGDRFILTPHASGFIDPLFSSGIALTTTFIVRFVPVIKQAILENDFATERFRWLETYFYRELNFIDKMVCGTIYSATHPELFKQYMSVWCEAASRAHMDMFVYNENQWPIFGSHDKLFAEAVDRAWKIVRDNFFKPAENQIKVAQEVKATLKPTGVVCKCAAFEFPLLSDKPVNGLRLRDPSLLRLVIAKEYKQVFVLLFVFLWFVCTYFLSYLGLTKYPYGKYWDRSFAFMVTHERKRFNFLPKRLVRVETADYEKNKWGIPVLTYIPELAKKTNKKDV